MENMLVHRNMGEQPRVRNLIEATFYIAFQDIWGGRFSRQHIEALADSVSRGSAFSEPVRVRIRRGFRNRIEPQQVKCLHRSVFHDGNRKRA